MSHNLEMASDFYRLTRNRRPAIKMLLSSVLGLVALGFWASITPINETVIHAVKIVAKSDAVDKGVGALKPSATISGQVVEILVSESQVVKKGDVLIRVDPTEYLILQKQENEKSASIEEEIEAKGIQLKLAVSTHETEKSELRTQLESENQLAITLASERQIKINLSNVELSRLTKELERNVKLWKQRAVAKSEIDTLSSGVQKAKEDVALAKLPLQDSEVAEIESKLHTLDSCHCERVHQIETETTVLRNQLKAASTEIELLEMKIAQCEIVATRDGLVSQCAIQVGEWVVPGPLNITVSQKGFMAEAFLPSALIGNVKNGDRAAISLDGLNWLINGSLFANVAMISPDLVQEEVVNGDGSTVVIDGYRVWMNLESNEDFGKWDSVRLGMTGSVEIQTGKKSLAIYMLEQAVGNGWIPSM